MRTWFVVALALSSALAGCLTEDPQESAVEPTDSLDSGGNETAVQNVTNAAPTANLTASVLNGSAPLAVNLTVDGSDADGDALNWTLDADGDGAADFNGTVLPSTVSFVYNATGNFTALLSVSDGNATTEANATIAVLAAEDEAGSDLPPFGTPETWYQHYDDCGGSFFMDLEDTTGDVDNCIQLLALNGETYVWPASVATNGHAAGSVVSGLVYMGASDPGLTSFTVTLKADGTAVGTASVGPAPHLGSGALSGVFSEFTYEFSLDSEVPAGAELELELTFGTGTRQTVIFGYEDDHASQFHIA